MEFSAKIVLKYAFYFGIINCKRGNAPIKIKGNTDMEKNENGFSPSPLNDSANGRSESNGNSDSGAQCSDSQLAMVYSPYQCWRMLYSPDDALTHGTLFEELYKPLEDCTNE